MRCLLTPLLLHLCETPSCSNGQSRLTKGRSELSILPPGLTPYRSHQLPREDSSFWQSSKNPTKDWEAEGGEAGAPAESSKALLAFNHMPWDSGLSQQA